MKTKGTRILEILYLVIGCLTVLEFLFVRGLFTWLIAVIAVGIVGAANILLSCKEKDWGKALLYLLCSAALCMGYWSLA